MPLLPRSQGWLAMSQKKLGDGLLALFGYPLAHENDAERAARAALSIQRALADLNRKNATSPN
jgi:class 3 adenylate cyclase